MFKLNQKGLATAAVIAMAGVLTTISIMIIRAGAGTSVQMSQSLNYYNTIEIIKANIYTIAGHPLGWYNTVNHANNTTSSGPTAWTKLDCVRTQTACGATAENAASVGASFRNVDIVYPIAGSTALYVSYVNANYGFDMQAKVCTTYEQTTVEGNAGCLIRPRVQWRAFCGSNCVVSYPRITAPWVANVQSTNNATNFNSTLSDPMLNRGFFYIAFETPNNGIDLKSKNSSLWGLAKP